MTPDLSAATWRTSSYSNGDGGNCVEVADGVPGVIPVRDTKNRSAAALLIPTTAWTPFIEATKNGTFPAH
ncbi:DUF397 domain-containing protein [Streptomyces litchfieldiae]|uniref:DUF397 domain-containing protein n=1 Tax=Streptomyces litchfieldiae TaxID=3075543 RepID=A0ABU2MQW3_9ACTN|nr:DUF397 domain-containing protein [Streptomyces sp. DSM 44938]MDT0343283.1 DUF397 domain-containing protein [Streptomyces sp. DSM 44938]